MKFITVAFLFQFLISCWPKSNINTRIEFSALYFIMWNSPMRLYDQLISPQYSMYQHEPLFHGTCEDMTNFSQMVAKLKLQLSYTAFELTNDFNCPIKLSLYVYR